MQYFFQNIKSYVSLASIMRPKGKAKIISRRKEALQLLKKLKSLTEVARIIRCAPSSVMRWRNTSSKKLMMVGVSSGRPPKLSQTQLRQLYNFLLKAPKSQGFQSKKWTLPLISKVIENRFDVHYHPDHVSRIMSELDLIYKKGSARRWIRKREG